MSEAPIDFGRAELVIRGAISGRIPLRTVAVCLACLLATLAVMVLALSLGTPRYDLGQVLATLSGRGTRLQNLIVLDWRLPRTLAGALFGAMLGASGALFQTLTRNPLGSPDIIGFTTGAHTGGVVAILLLGTGYYTVMSGALVGGLVTAALVLALTRQGTAMGFHMIIIGIGVTSMLASVDSYLVLTADLDLAMVAAAWGAGSLNATAWGYVLPSLVLGGALLALAALVSWRVAQLDLGDDQANALGAGTRTTRLLVVGVGVALVAVVTSVTGPIAFVALAAPQIGRRLAASTGTPMAPAAAVGALVLPTADLLAQHAMGPGVPVGVVTVLLGGAYLLFLIITEARKGSLS